MSRAGLSHHTGPRHAVASTIFAFFTSVFLAAGFVLCVAYFGFMNEHGFLGSFDDDYYQYTLDYVHDQAVYYTLPTGYDIKVVDGVFSTEEIRADVEQHVISAFGGNSYEPDTTVQHDRLVANVSALYASDGNTLTQEDTEAMESYAEAIMDIYKKSVKVPGLESIAKVRNRIGLIALGAAAACLLFAVLLSVFTVRLHHYPHRGLRFVAYATGGASLLCLVAPLVVYVSGFYRRISISPEYFYHFGVKAIERLLFFSMAGGAVYLALTFVLIMVIRKKRGLLINKHSRSHMMDAWEI